jgi:hypothetical protein
MFVLWRVVAHLGVLRGGMGDRRKKATGPQRVRRPAKVHDQGRRGVGVQGGECRHTAPPRRVMANAHRRCPVQSKFMLLAVNACELGPTSLCQPMYELFSRIALYTAHGPSATPHALPDSIFLFA